MNEAQNHCGTQQMQNPNRGLLQGGYGAMSQDCAQDRQTAKGALRVRVRQLRNEADRLEALAKALPEELPPMADKALYDLIRAAT